MSPNLSHAAVLVAVSDMRLFEKDTARKAICNVTLSLVEGEITIYGVNVFESKGRHPWISLPTRQVGDGYAPVIEASAGIQGPIHAEVASEYLRQKPQPPLDLAWGQE